MDDLKQINLSDEPETIENQDKHNMEDRLMEPVKKSKLMPTLVVAGIILGLGSGFFFAQNRLAGTGVGGPLSPATQELNSDTTVKKGDVFGSADESTFRDQADGILMPGGIEGEGSHHIERGENKSQWVYITSTVVDLDQVVGHRVTVWGETTTGKKAGWLMDVGRLKVLELDAAPVTTDDTELD